MITRILDDTAFHIEFPLAYPNDHEGIRLITGGVQTGYVEEPACGKLPVREPFEEDFNRSTYRDDQNIYTFTVIHRETDHEGSMLLVWNRWIR